MRSTETRASSHIALALALITFAGCVGSGPAAPAHVSPAPDSTLGAGDSFEVTVYEEKELSGKYQVADDGTINFPLLGSIVAAGKVPTDVARTIQDALRDRKILRNPSVSIYVTEYASKRFSVVGAVARPGSFTLTTGMTVVQAISLAGGFTPLASKNSTIVTRRVNGKLERYTVQVGMVTEGHQDDFGLQPGDIVYVPDRIF